MTLPSGWKIATLRELIKCEGGNSFPLAMQGNSEGEIPFFKVSDMTRLGNETYLETAANYLSAGQCSALKGKLKPSLSVTFPKVGGALLTNKKRILKRPSLIDNNVMAAWTLDGETLDPLFHYFVWQGIDLRDLSNPGPLPSINGTAVYEKSIMLPPIGEQRKIAAILSKIQQAIEIETNLIRVTHELKAAIMKKLFTEGLYGEPQKETEIGMVPESWKVVSLSSIGRVGGGTTPDRKQLDYWRSGDIPWITSGRMYEREIRGSEEHITSQAVQDLNLPLLNPGAVLIAIVGQGKTLGHCAILKVKATISRHVGYIQPDESLISAEFLRDFLESRYDLLRQLASGNGSTRAALTGAIIKRLQLPLPPSLEEQRKIASVLDAINRQINISLSKKRALEDLFTTLLQKLMSGTIRITNLKIDTSCLEHDIPSKLAPKWQEFQEIMDDHLETQSHG